MRITVMDSPVVGVSQGCSLGDEGRVLAGGLSGTMHVAWGRPLVGLRRWRRFAQNAGVEVT